MVGSVLTSVYLLVSGNMRGRIGVGAIAVGAHELFPVWSGPVMADPRRASGVALSRCCRGTTAVGGLPASKPGLDAIMTDSELSAWRLLSAFQSTTQRSQLALPAIGDPRGLLVI